MKCHMGVFAALLLAGLLLGCDGDNTCAPCADGRIVGRILSANGPVVGSRIYVESVDATPGYRLRAETVSDSTGRFVFALPAGSYLLSALPSYEIYPMWFSGLGPTCVRAEADTLAVTRGAVATADFVLGALDIEMDVPPGLEGAAITCAAHGIDGGNRVARGTRFVDSPALSFSFPTIPPGTYNIHVEVNPYYDASTESLMWLEHTLVVEDADTFTVRAREATLWRGALPVPGYLQGIVQGCWIEAGLRTPSVYVYDIEKRVTARQRVDHQGAFAVPMFAPGQVCLWYRHGDHSGWVGGSSFEEAELFHVGSGIVIDVNPIVLSCIVGHVAESALWEISSAYLSLYRGEPDDFLDSYFLRNDVVFAFSGLEPGAYYLSILPHAGEAWRPQWYDRAANRETATPIIVAEDGEIVDIEVTLEKGGVIRGRVFDATGAGVENVDLLITSISTDWSVPGDWRTESDGSFEIAGLPDGDLIIGVRYYVGEDRTYSYYPGTADPDSAEIITIIDASEVTGIEWQIEGNL
ncbi:MAG: carboxypeptidase regulatory-like domain-containing protein [Candidatus Eisenbacteria sp.]|nr:carboxypeptidase regulatory-like domain-containing protein [Candidatus Eisenbacteria bacterium]